MGFKHTFWDTKEIQHDLGGARKNYMLRISSLFRSSRQQAIKKVKLQLNDVVFSLVMFFFKKFLIAVLMQPENKALGKIVP